MSTSDRTSSSAEPQVRTIVGLEIHVQLATKTKLFCGCAAEFGAAPNSRLCPVCLGLPGALPVMNRQAFEYAVIAGLALNCTIAERTKWDRKSYYYPDMPKNYQISQYDQPLAYEGWFEVPIDGEIKRVRIRRAHLEEDAGKSIHDEGHRLQTGATPGCTLIDLNRAGTPLLEIVTEPDLESAEQAYVFCTELQRLVTYLGVSEGVMQKGQMRFEPNVNVAIVKDGVEYRTPIAEIKNLNSFRAVRAAIDYETKRQYEQWRSDPGYLLNERPNENRGWDDNRQATVFQRGKEAAHDYRYFPEPDLAPVEVDRQWLDGLREAMPELPLARRARLVEQLALSERDVDVIVTDRATADLFEAVVWHRFATGEGTPVSPAHRLETGATLAVKQFINLWCKLANDRGVTPAELDIGADRIAGLVRLVDEGTVSATAANRIAEAMLDSSDGPAELADSMGLVQVQDQAQMAAWVNQAIEDNPRAIETIRTNPKKAKATEGFLSGQVMKLSKGQADPKLAGELIRERLRDLLS
ncbi:MAG: Asp-tRNA(Asn)/Glu-tRNA(Gln) amidotransferase subunit GatB [Planctomycetes bacterium]|nr:Asp-tRNA(Asn)/Glu-tRNA(Gln) amidotransferase subunit GatB [Planctomycetota bacterium]